MDPNYPYQSHYSSSAAQTPGYYPTASAAPTTDPGPTGEDFQQQTAAHLGHEDPLQAPPSSHAGPYSAPHPSQHDSYRGQQTGYTSSYGGSHIGYSDQYGYPHQPATHQQSYGDDLDQYNFRTGLRSGVPPPRHEGQYLPPPSTGQNAPSVTAVDEPVNQGTSRGPDAQGLQASGSQTRPGYPREHVRQEWSVRSDWVFSAGSLVDGRNYTEEQFRRDYDKVWKHRAVAKKDLWEEFLDLRFEYLGY